MTSESPAAATTSVGRAGRVWRGPVLFLVGAGGAFLLAAREVATPWAVPLALPLLLLATAGLLDALGLFRPRPDPRPLGDTWLGAQPGEAGWIAPRYTLPVALAVGLAGVVVGGAPAVPWVVPVAALPLAPAALRRPGLFVGLVAVLLYLPTLGVFGLWDPWETHYGEVAREILARNDWISLWWAQEEWFWSKPVLVFWAEALSMRVFGVDPTPDAHPLQAEWAVRFPVFVWSVVATVALYAAVARTWGRRAGVLAALVLLTSPHFYLLGRQAITDMPFVASVAAAMALLLLALQEDPEREVRPVALGLLQLGPEHAAIGGVVMLALPQILYLLSRNVTVFGDGVGVHGDTFFSGSAGNDGIAGNPAPAFDLSPRFDGLLAQPAAQALLWIALLAAIVWALRRERRAQPLLMVGFYVACALGFLGKGIPGFALPGLVALLTLVATRRWDLLLEGRLRVGLGALVVSVIGLPWFFAMVARHGYGFLDRLLVHDHLKRLGTGVHGDKGSLEYFVEQLGFATFPWAGLALAAVVWALVEVGRRRDRPRAAEPLVLVVLWFAATFTLFSAMVTKFHHYIFPAVPPLAVLTGLFLDALLGPGPEGRRRGARLGLAALAAVPLAIGLGGSFGDVRGVVPEGAPEDWVLAHPWPPLLAHGLVALGLALLTAAAAPGDADRLGPPPRRRLFAAAAAGALAVGAAVGPAGLAVVGLGLVAALVWLRGPTDRGDADPAAALVVLGAAAVAFVGRDLSWSTLSRPQGSERLIQLFVYNYDRPYPEFLDYRAALSGFAVAAGVLHGLLALRATRRAAVHGLVGLALAFTVWVVDVYLLDVSPHWTQRALVDRYYAERKGPEEPLVAWQMNWKGENFYTGNRVHVFAELDNEGVRDWIRAHDGQTAFFLMERARLARFRALVPSGDLEPLTDERLCNKFVLVRAAL